MSEPETATVYRFPKRQVGRAPAARSHKQHFRRKFHHSEITMGSVLIFQTKRAHDYANKQLRVVGFADRYNGQRYRGQPKHSDDLVVLRYGSKTIKRYLNYVSTHTNWLLLA